MTTATRPTTTTSTYRGLSREQVAATEAAIRLRRRRAGCNDTLPLIDVEEAARREEGNPNA